MTKPQIWITAFLIIFFLLFLLQKFTKQSEEHPIVINEPYEENTNLTAELSGYDLMKKYNCLNCHGEFLEGTSMGPKLENLQRYWDRNNLISYLRNPMSFMGQERFKEYRIKYPNIIMPAYDNLDIKELGKIVDFLLMK